MIIKSTVITCYHVVVEDSDSLLKKLGKYLNIAIAQCKNIFHYKSCQK